MQGLFSAEALRSAREIGAANIASGGPALKLKGTLGDLDARAGFFGGMASAWAGKK